MNPPLPTDREIEHELRAALRAEAGRLTPSPGLQPILERTHRRSRAARHRRRWIPALAGAVATAGIAAATIAVLAPSDESSRPDVTTTPCAVEVQPGCRVELAVYFADRSAEHLRSADIRVTSSGNVGRDSVQALLAAHSHERNGIVNFWHGYATQQERPIAHVIDVSHAGGVITTDFDRPLTSGLASLEGGSGFGTIPLQQLVLTVQSALRTDDPVRITVDGKAADQAFGQPLTGPVDADWSLVAGIRPETPGQGETVSSPVTIAGTSTSFEGNLLWEVSRAGELVDSGHTTGGSMGTYARFSFRVHLAPGTYTVKLWEPNEASGREAWTDALSVVYVEFTVE